MDDLQTLIEQVREEIKQTVDRRNELVEEKKIVDRKLIRFYHDLALFERRRGSENDKEERWIPIAGWKGKYEVSSWGRVRRVDGFTCDNRRWKGRILRPETSKAGYLRVILSDGWGRKRCSVNRLVCWAFHGTCRKGYETRHLDGDPGNNHENNLIWGTKQQNEADKKTHGTVPLGSKNGRAVLNERQVYRIRLTAPPLRPICVLASMFNVHRTTISRVINRKTWKHI